MSKGGGAGKVYFVLYLAVVLELLIIIVERDEAEEHLLKKQKETMRIVESILQQLQSGAGTEGINTRPQDEITILPAGIDLKQVMDSDIRSFRKYIIEVGVTDISNELKWNKSSGEQKKEYDLRLMKLVKLANVEEIEYQIFYNESEDPSNAPMFISDDSIKKKKIDFTKWEEGQEIYADDGTAWKFLGLRKLILDDKKTFDKVSNIENLTPEMIVPVYPSPLIIGPDYAPKEIDRDSIFFYDENIDIDGASRIATSSSLKKRSFFVFFEPPAKAGWYKLRFASQTNRILGVKSGENYAEIPENTTVNIGTVQLTVKDLRKVLKELSSTLEKYKHVLPELDVLVKEQNLEKFQMKLVQARAETIKIEQTETESKEMQNKIDLYGYIAKLLAPGQSINFDQNRGSIEFNIRVVTPQMKISKPTVTSLKYTAWFDAVPPVFDFEIQPYQGPNANIVAGRVLDSDGREVAKVNSVMAQAQSVVAGIGSAAEGGSRRFIGTVDRTLPASDKKYTIEITHRIGSQAPAVATTELEVFPSKIANEDEAMAYFKGRYSYSYYGDNVTVTYKPASGTKILADQFRTYLYTDKETQITPQIGLSNMITCQANQSQIFTKLTWIVPHSADADGRNPREITLFPNDKPIEVENIKQRPPRINSRNQRELPSGPENRIQVVVSGILISGSKTGSNDRPDADVIVDKNIKVNTDNLRNVKSASASSVIVVEEGKGEYKFSFELSVKMADMKKILEGDVSFDVTAYAVNPVNSKSSDRITEKVTVKSLDGWSPEGLGGTQGAPGSNVPGVRGGSPPPPGGGAGGTGTPPPPGGRGGSQGGSTPPPRR